MYFFTKVHFDRQKYIKDARDEDISSKGMKQTLWVRRAVKAHFFHLVSGAYYVPYNKVE